VHHFRDFNSRRESLRSDVAVEPLTKDQLELQMHGLLKKVIVNISSRLEYLRYQPREKSKINIPLCHMNYLLVVRPFKKMM
jgi:hypothetical protein